MKKIIIGLLLLSLLIFGCQSKGDNKLIEGQLGKFTSLKHWNKNVTDHISTSYLIDHNGSKKLVQFVKVHGFQGVISLMVTMNISENKIEDIHINQQNESPDYGGFIKESWYLDRYKEKSIKSPLKTVVMMDKQPNEVVAVTGATISSGAVTEAVNYCIENINYLQIKSEGDEK